MQLSSLPEKFRGKEGSRRQGMELKEYPEKKKISRLGESTASKSSHHGALKGEK